MRRVALFGATVLLPCGLLVVFGLILIRQDRELASRRLDDQRRAHAVQQRQDRLARLERLKHTAAEDFFAGRRPSVEFAALVVNYALPPLSADAAPPPLLAPCEQLEFAEGRLGEAVACYLRVLPQTSGRSRSFARLMLGRALLRSGDTRREIQVDLELLAAPFDHTDDQGVPLAFYAAERLLSDPAAAQQIATRFAPDDAGAAARSQPAAYLLKSIAGRVGGEATLLRQAEAAVERANAAESLRAALGGLLPVLRTGGPEPVWIEHGPWQIGLDRSPESGRELIVGVASRLLPPLSPVPSDDSPPQRSGIYVASLALVFLLALSGSYLLWRDTRRDAELAAMRSQFVSSVSHELKTPLTSIRMFAETLRLRPAAGSTAREEYLDTIIHESERLSRLVDNILDYSKIEQGRKLYHLRRTPLAAIVDSIVRAVRYPVEASGFALQVAVQEPLPEIDADPDAVQQAVLNLLANAIKYSADRKEIELDVRADASGASIGVRDFGLGIPAEHRQRIFDRFYRVPSPANDRVPGAGLGLTLVAHIAAAHGGAVTVESAPGEGSLFTLRLPLEQRA